MDNSIRRQESDTHQPRDFQARLQIVNGILNWLADLFQLTEEEQIDAGIYLGD